MLARLDIYMAEGNSLVSLKVMSDSNFNVEISVPKPLVTYLEHSHHQVLDTLESITYRLVMLAKLGADANTFGADRFGVDDSHIVQQGAAALASAGQQMLSWWIVARVATCLREHDVNLDSEDVDTMCQRFVESNGDLDYVFGYLLSAEAILIAHAVALSVATGEDEGEIDVTGTRPSLPEISELQKIDEALQRVVARHC